MPSNHSPLGDWALFPLQGQTARGTLRAWGWGGWSWPGDAQTESHLDPLSLSWPYIQVDALEEEVRMRNIGTQDPQNSGAETLRTSCKAGILVFPMGPSWTAALLFLNGILKCEWVGTCFGRCREEGFGEIPPHLMMGRCPTIKECLSNDGMYTYGHMENAGQC